MKRELEDGLLEFCVQQKKSFGMSKGKEPELEI
jgi:hypothetical protein